MISVREKGFGLSGTQQEQRHDWTNFSLAVLRRCVHTTHNAVENIAPELTQTSKEGQEKLKRDLYESINQYFNQLNRLLDEANEVLRLTRTDSHSLKDTTKKSVHKIDALYRQLYLSSGYYPSIDFYSPTINESNTGLRVIEKIIQSSKIGFPGEFDNTIKALRKKIQQANNKRNREYCTSCFF